MDLKDTYNKIARDWFKDHHKDNWWVPGVDKLLSMLPANASILDIGCGAGQKTEYLVNKGINVTGADFSEEMVTIAKEQMPATRFLVLDFYNIDEVEETFDCVVAQAVLLHIPKKDVVRVLEKTKQVLKPSGLLYLAVKERRQGSPDEKGEVENDYGDEYKRFFSYFSIPELKSYLEQAGFSVVSSDVVDLGHTRWIQVIAQTQTL